MQLSYVVLPRHTSSHSIKCSITDNWYCDFLSVRSFRFWLYYIYKQYSMHAHECLVCFSYCSIGIHLLWFIECQFSKEFNGKLMFLHYHCFQTCNLIFALHPCFIFHCALAVSSHHFLTLDRCKESTMSSCTTVHALTEATSLLLHYWWLDFCSQCSMSGHHNCHMLVFAYRQRIFLLICMVTAKFLEYLIDVLYVQRSRIDNSMDEMQESIEYF